MTTSGVTFSAAANATMQRLTPFYITLSEGLTIALRVRMDSIPASGALAPLVQLWTARRSAHVLSLDWLRSSQELRLSWRDAQGQAQLVLRSGALALGQFATVAFRLSNETPLYQVYVDGELVLDSRTEVRSLLSCFRCITLLILRCRRGEQSDNAQDCVVRSANGNCAWRCCRRPLRSESQAGGGCSRARLTMSVLQRTQIF